MTRKEFLAELAARGADPNAVVFDDPVSDGYVLRKSYFRWEVGFRERGTETNLVGFPSEQCAMQALLDELTKTR